MCQSKCNFKSEEESCIFQAFALPHETFSVLALDSDRPGSVDQKDEDLPDLVLFLLLAHGKDLILKDHRWRTKVFTGTTDHASFDLVCQTVFCSHVFSL